MKIAMLHEPMRRIFVFSVPVRIFHWVNAFAILILIATGLIMANPPAIQQGQEASFGYWFGTVRFIHFATAYIFTVFFVMRIYFMFFGNKFEGWRNFVPTNRKFFKNVWRVIRYDVLLKKNVKQFEIGHNALAGLSYFILFIFMILMIVTGFALYSNMSTALFPQLFNWVTPLLGGDITVRIVHHTAMWIFVLFILIHVYLVFYHDYVEGRGEISSMGGGWKFVNSDLLKKHLEEEREEKKSKKEREESKKG